MPSDQVVEGACSVGAFDTTHVAFIGFDILAERTAVQGIETITVVGSPEVVLLDVIPSRAAQFDCGVAFRSVSGSGCMVDGKDVEFCLDVRYAPLEPLLKRARADGVGHPGTVVPVVGNGIDVAAQALHISVPHSAPVGRLAQGWRPPGATRGVQCRRISRRRGVGGGAVYGGTGCARGLRRGARELCGTPLPRGA